MEHLYDKLTEYASGEDYPYHMPGHKRHVYGEMPPDAYAMDLTEIDGFDDLHAPKGILRELQERVAKLYGADESFCLVGGSTAGILAALSAALPVGGRLLMARNGHKAAYHASYLRSLRVTYLLPGIVDGFGICDAVRPEEVASALDHAPDTQAVLIVSPTYEGRISPIREIAELVHARGKILIVDEAHGAHLGLAGKWRTDAFLYQDEASKARSVITENSCQAGADIVIHSVHKTLPAMTQTALLHVNGDRVDREKLRRFLRIYQSSSPSYVLMASIDNAVTLMERDGERLLGDLVKEFTLLKKELSVCRHFRILDDIHQDVGKLVIHAGNSGLTGQQIYDILREKYHLQLEMAAGDYCLAMFTVGDTQEGYQRLRDALLEMDAQAGSSCKEFGLNKVPYNSEAPVIARNLKEAWDAPWEETELAACEGRISAEFVNLYPPGTPIVVPGEIFTKKIVKMLLCYLAQGLRLRGVSEEGTVRCLMEVRSDR